MDGTVLTMHIKPGCVCVCQESFQVSATAVGSVLQLVDRVLASELRNGFAVIRPPGHHAQADQPNGFCMFNNVAIAARYAQKRHAVSRVLIVDWDVHHGQGIQYLFQEDPSVLYFSVHRYEGGSFWPHLPESDCSFVGSGRAEGRNINLPWNKTGMSDADYITAFQQLLLPVAYEFQPQLVLVAAGFDAAAGDPKGQMCVSPQCFHILTHMLMGLAEGWLVLALEGGYELQATAEAVAACVRALLGGACPPLSPPTAPSDSALRSISQTVSALYPHWASLQVLSGPGAEDRVTRAAADHSSPALASINTSAASTTGLVYDEKMMEHDTLYVVDPLPWCPHLDAVKPLPHSGIDVFQPCGDCGSDAENWICLTCYQVCCGRYVNEHMVTHGAVMEHPMVLSFADLSVWCYLCESYIHHQVRGIRPPHTHADVTGWGPYPPHPGGELRLNIPPLLIGYGLIFLHS
uniref:Histone deacetylase 6 n=1 Tax=Fundulus heteroclitus TaxID=8078 RepID=A0A3Q2PSL3_FUNHE